jgi:hypothetical protein
MGIVDVTKLMKSIPVATSGEVVEILVADGAPATHRRSADPRRRRSLCSCMAIGATTTYSRALPSGSDTCRRPPSAPPLDGHRAEPRGGSGRPGQPSRLVARTYYVARSSNESNVRFFECAHSVIPTSPLKPSQDCSSVPARPS